MKLVHNENSDLLEECLPLNQSLFEEIFNSKMWDWYYQLGLTNTHRRRTYVYFKNKKMLFDESAISLNQNKKTVWSKIKSSAKFSYQSSKLLQEYKPEIINKLYEKEMLQDYKNVRKEVILDKLSNIWKLLINNFKYAILANLIIQYKTNIPDKFQEDLTAKRINAIVQLNKGQITKKMFDKEFGFLADSDYDFSCKRYYEQKKILLTAEHEIEPKKGRHNFRDYVKFQNIKLIAILRKLFLALNDKDVFYKQKKEILEEQKVDVKPRKIIEKKKVLKINKRQELINGTKICGKGIVEGNVFIVDNFNDLSKAKKGCIVVTRTLHPNLAALVPICEGIISERGGKLSHLAIVARERDVPVITDAEHAQTILRNFKRVRILVDQGVIIVIR